MHYKVYGIPNCNTVKKALDWLDHHQISYTFHNYKKETPTETLLTNWLAQTEWTSLVNRSGMTWRKLDEATKQSLIDGPSAIPLMIAQSSVIKRPIIVDNKGIIQTIGFEEATYTGTFC